MATAAAVLKTAASQIGVHENASRPNHIKYWADLKPEWQGANWCAAFVQWCLKKNGMWYNTPLPYFVPSFVQTAKKTGAWKTGGAKAGDLVIYDFGKGSAQHIGFFERYTHFGIQTIEGNTSYFNSGSQNNGEGVYRKIRSSGVMGFVAMKYDAAPKAGGRLLSTDGIFDTGTIKVVQKWIGTTVDGDFGPKSVAALQKRVKRPQTGRWTQADSNALAVLVGKPELKGKAWSYAWRDKPTAHTKAIEEYLNRAIKAGSFVA